MNNIFKYSGFSLFLSLSLIISAWLVADAVKKSVPSNQIVKVRGVAEQLIDADRVSWNITVSSTNKIASEAYSKVDQDIATITNFIKESGVSESTISTSGHSQSSKTKRVYTDKNGNYEDKFLGFVISRGLTVEGEVDFNLVKKLHESINSSLLKNKIKFTNSSPYYYQSKPVSELKPQLLEAAAKSAFVRATIIAKSSNGTLGPLKAARQGDFNGFSNDGKVGGSTTQSRISAVVTVDYSLK